MAGTAPSRRPLVLDGGLATRLEAYGRDLGGGLWSARLLAEEPDLVRRVHRDYFEAGADVAIAAGYQASVPALTARGATESEALALIARSVELARAERDAFGSGLVAAGVGPYGAARADGSEYTGDYDLDEEGLYAWHRERWRVLADSGADLLACETVPSAAEARALARLLAETPGARAWISFSCRDGERVSDGTPLREAAAGLAPLHADGRLVAVGVNCTAPRHVPALVRAVAACGLPAVAYPNSGEEWDAARGRWTGTAEPEEFGRAAVGWYEAGAVLVGGCCRTGPEHVRSVRAHLDRAAP
ncbi:MULTISPECIES: homocysteine S-methyltransferase [Nocardiopsis]|uniref:Homocysteine S-methyltransferase n=1 Tax=Nocardiopsis dassonvillei (strain ATCC 23218 / DSM 43111 / CIP 107115 / JCM 7437 / KCTC 9190 / NBRC 14626 / NCTC 10488 / NRRL B-5397 / IMRU 509) TaxID=446468 RepID=D7B0C8_NOCDD|nr:MULTISPECIES: homocysteine S-methyltransferase [Nocardiopsis]ADH66335.1 homocysteine S-methyltransferase [Nocardiopsis dassonvillei subsp. dassonvillei DSM 43111]APC34656.1 homocysteine S-methyltransferase [Nocardiopsis dassonvillei]NKY79972.1 homocysteine S-methyltransferase [Nocardiopsis dassonvillei]VEI92356.1 Homocysteine S-methyltransferase [Nocardiopsis dassonvillei]